MRAVNCNFLTRYNVVSLIFFFSVRELNKKLYKYAYTYKNYKWSGMNGFHFKKNTYTLRMVCDETVCKPCLFLEFSRAKKSLFTDCRLGWFIVDTCCIFKSISALKSPECNSANMTRMVREEDKKGRIKKKRWTIFCHW